MRDTQKQRLYDAENRLPRGREYPTMREAQRRVDAIVGSEWWKRNAVNGGWKTHVHVEDGRGRRRALSYGGSIALPKWARCERVILHELAHEAMPRGERHGPNFARTLHGMFRRFMGREVADAFLVECAARGVKIAGKRLPRSRVTEEHREAAAKTRAVRRAHRDAGRFERALDDAAESARNTGDRVTVELHPGIGWMWGTLPEPLPIATAWGAKRCKAVVEPDGTVHLRR